jgi:hypothetical protein
MPATYLNSTTLSAALNKDDNEFTVAATTNISVDSLLVVRGEAMHVRAIPVSGRVVVRRGYQGTRSVAHPNGAKVWIGSADAFKTIKDNAAAIVGDSGELPDFCLPGTRAIDQAGNEYVMLDLTASLVQGATVLISNDGNFTASVISSTSHGPVALLAEGGTSNQWVWGQIYGYNAHAKLVGGSSLATTLGELGGATSVSTPSVGLLGRSSSQKSSDWAVASIIHGAFLASAATTASTSASSETGYYAAVWLNYPYITRVVTT